MKRLFIKHTTDIIALLDEIIADPVLRVAPYCQVTFTKTGGLVELWVW